MDKKKFMFNNILGSVLWSFSMIFAGHYCLDCEAHPYIYFKQMQKERVLPLDEYQAHVADLFASIDMQIWSESLLQQAAGIPVRSQRWPRPHSHSRSRRPQVPPRRPRQARRRALRPRPSRSSARSPREDSWRAGVGA